MIINTQDIIESDFGKIYTTVTTVQNPGAPATKRLRSSARHQVYFVAIGEQS